MNAELAKATVLVAPNKCMILRVDYQPSLIPRVRINIRGIHLTQAQVVSALSSRVALVIAMSGGGRKAG